MVKIMSNNKIVRKKQKYHVTYTEEKIKSIVLRVEKKNVSIKSGVSLTVK